MRPLTLNLKGAYFAEIANGTKEFEFRLLTEYWRKRLENKEFSEIVIKLGYPRSDEHARIIRRPWRGFEIQIIEHPLFGSRPVTVFAIRVN